MVKFTIKITWPHSRELYSDCKINTLSHCQFNQQFIKMASVLHTFTTGVFTCDSPFITQKLSIAKEQEHLRCRRAPNSTATTTQAVRLTQKY